MSTLLTPPVAPGCPDPGLLAYTPQWRWRAWTPDSLPPAARRAAVGDLLIIAAFAQVPEAQCKGFEPKLVFVDGANRIKEQRSHIPVQEASHVPAHAEHHGGDSA